MQSFTWTARVTSLDGERAAAVVRQHRFEIGAPVRFDDEYSDITALEHVLGAIGADLVTGLRILARKRRVPVDNVEATVTGELNNPLTHLGVVGEEGHPGLERVRIRVYVSTMAPRDDVQSIWDEMILKSPLLCTFRSALDLELDFKVVL